jgi:hypothetical protein
MSCAGIINTAIVHILTVAVCPVLGATVKTVEEDILWLDSVENPG